MYALAAPQLSFEARNRLILLPPLLAAVSIFFWAVRAITSLRRKSLKASRQNGGLLNGHAAESSSKELDITRSHIYTGFSVVRVLAVLVLLALSTFSAVAGDGPVLQRLLEVAFYVSCTSSRAWPAHVSQVYALFLAFAVATLPLGPSRSVASLDLTLLLLAAFVVRLLIYVWPAVLADPVGRPPINAVTAATIALLGIASAVVPLVQPRSLEVRVLPLFCQLTSETSWTAICKSPRASVTHISRHLHVSGPAHHFRPWSQGCPARCTPSGPGKGALGRSRGEVFPGAHLADRSYPDCANGRNSVSRPSGEQEASPFLLELHNSIPYVLLAEMISARSNGDFSGYEIGSLTLCYCLYVCL